MGFERLVSGEENKMTNSYNFTLDPNNFTQLGDTRFFEIQADKESVDRFIKDLELFEKKRSEEDD